MTLFWPALTLTLVSAASMALEIVAGRALAPYVGMSLYSWTVIIAVVLAGLSLGHWIGGALADRAGRLRWIAGALLAAAAATFLSLALLRATAPFMGGADPVAHVGALALAAFFAPSLLAGMLSPLLTAAALDGAAPGRRGRVLGLMFALGAFGAIVGTLAAGLVMISWIGTAGSVAAIAGLYAVLSLRFLAVRGRAAAAAIAALGAGGAATAPEALGLSGVCLKESAYFCIRVDEAPGFGRPARVMALDHLAHGLNDAEDPRLLLAPYVQGVDELVALRRPGPALDAFFIGGGAYSLPRAWLARYPRGRFIAAELDPEVTRVATERLWLTPSPRLDIRHGDARRILSGLPEEMRFDVIFGDAFHDISVPQHLVTDEFHAVVKARLRVGGVYALNVVDAQRAPRFLLSLATTLKRRFAHVELWIDRAALSPVETRTTWILLASDIATGRPFVRSRYGFRREWAQAPLEAMAAHVGAERLAFLTDDFAPVDRLLAHVLLSGDLAEAAD